MARRLLSIPKGAAQLGLSAWSLRREIASGDGPPTVRIGQRAWLDQDGFDEWLDRRRAASRPASPTPDTAP